MIMKMQTIQNKTGLCHSFSDKFRWPRGGRLYFLKRREGGQIGKEGQKRFTFLREEGKKCLEAPEGDR